MNFSRFAGLAGMSAIITISSFAQPKAYSTHSSGNTVSVVSTATDAVLRTIAVSAGPSKIAISKDGLRAYVIHAGSNSVTVINTSTDTVTGTILLSGSPSAIGLTPNGETAYIAIPGAVQAITLATGAVRASIPVGTSVTGIAVRPDGARAYFAAGASVIVADTATNTILTSFAPNDPANPGATNSAVGVAMAPSGNRAYVAVEVYSGGFIPTGGVVVLDTATNAIVTVMYTGSLPGEIALAPDGSRGYIGMGGTWVDTGYGQGFFPGSSVAVFDTASNTIGGQINLGAGGASWSLQNTPAGIAVTPDRSEVYVVVPRLSSIAVVDINTNTIRQTTAITAGPYHLAITPDAAAVITPYLIDAVDDTVTAAYPSTGGTAVANVLANDRLGGLAARLSSVSLSQVSTTNAGLALQAGTGAVTVAAGTATGTHSLVYRICELSYPTNCDNATVTVPVRAPYIIDAVNDAATAVTGVVAVANVLANDTLGGTAATAAVVNMTTLSTTNPGVTLNPANGAVSVAALTPVGVQTLVYQICEKASPSNCDTAAVAVTVIPFVVDAVNDAGTVSRAGGTAVANVLANDRFNNTAATAANVSLALVSSTNTGVTLNLTTGAVTVAPGTAAGVHTLNYRICEVASPANCDTAAVTVTVTAYVIDAVNDSARGSSKGPNTPLASVLTNDTFGGAAATVAKVVISQVSLTPPNPKIRLDVTDGSVDVLGKTNSGLYSLVYKICEIGNTSNCDTATVSLDLSGK